MDASELCFACGDLTRDFFDPKKRFPVSISLTNYGEILNRKDSCPLCALICTGLRRAFLWRDCTSDEAANVDAKIWDRYSWQEIRHNFGWAGGGYYYETCCKGVKIGRLNLCGIEILQVRLGTLVSYYRIRHPDSLEGRANNLQRRTELPNVKEWLGNEFTGKPPGELPNRVLALRNRNDEHLTADICLLDRNRTRDINERYMALSHRWSKSPHLRLTNRTYQRWLDNIPFQNLPRLFQDAVIFCRHMGVYYLWIDALCIKQDDEEDWRSESKCMGDIFENADCVIMAHSSQGDGYGFLEEALRPPKVILLGSSKPGRGAQFYVSDRTTAKGAIDESPLSKRGWVFQERLLATRAVHFTRGNVLMEHIGDLEGAGLVDPAIPQRDLKRLLHGQDKASPRDFRHLWAKLVESYSACTLTMDKDKIPAISGLARKLQSSQGNPYFLSGLWSQGLPEQLLWITTGSSVTRVEWRAPSWSWASLDGTVEFLQPGRLIQSDTLFVDGFRSSSLDKKAAWVDGRCALAVRGSVVEWDEDKIRGPHSPLDKDYVCITQNSNLGQQIKGMGRKVQPLRSTEVEGHINGWVSYDFEDRQRNLRNTKAAGRWELRALKRPNFLHRDDNQPTWIPLSTGLEAWISKPSERTLPRRICVRACSYTPDQDRGEPNLQGKKNHLFLILQRIGGTEQYKRIGVGEVFLEDFFRDVRGDGSEAKKLEFLGHERKLEIV